MDQIEREVIRFLQQTIRRKTKDGGTTYRTNLSGSLGRFGGPELRGWLQNNYPNQSLDKFFFKHRRYFRYDEATGFIFINEDIDYFGERGARAGGELLNSCQPLENQGTSIPVQVREEKERSETRVKRSEEEEAESLVPKVKILEWLQERRQLFTRSQTGSDGVAIEGKQAWKGVEGGVEIVDNCTQTLSTGHIFVKHY